MAARGTTFAKQDRERAKKAKAAQKQERRAAREAEAAEVPEVPTEGEIPPEMLLGECRATCSHGGLLEGGGP